MGHPSSASPDAGHPQPLPDANRSTDRLASSFPESRNPYRDYEPAPINGCWWLCVNGDPERIAHGVFTSRESAERYKARMVDGWDVANRARIERATANWRASAQGDAP